MSDPTTALMQRIKSEWGAAIDALCASSSVLAAFLAALIANESGGNANATRFEPTVCRNIQAVIAGEKTAYNPPGSRRSLASSELSGYIHASGGNDLSGAPAVHNINDIATSYGLTQIMGFHVLMWADVLQLPQGFDIPQFFADPTAQLKFTLQLLDSCAEANLLDLGMPDDQTAGEFFTWWNCGRVNGKTYDPNYVPNGIARMDIYSQIEKGAT